MPEHDTTAMGRVRKVHFVGIGGAGMSGIAEVLHNLGYQVSGSDLQRTPVTDRLQGLGISISNTHAEYQVNNVDVVVVSSAIDATNVEVMAAQAARVPVVPRAEMLSEIMRFRYGIAVAGTHGKTTTTSLVASLLAEGGLDPTYVIGGRLNSTGAHARLGGGRYLVAEADESDASFLHLQPVITVLTNVDSDHLSTYGGDVEQLRATFIEFLQRLPFYGLAVICSDDAGAASILSSLSKPYITYGTNEQADIRAFNVVQDGATTRFSVARPGHEQWLDIKLNLAGDHNVLNALGAIAVAHELGVDESSIVRALEKFEGIARRFQIIGDVRIGAAKVLLIDDYGHHPTEITATLNAIRSGWPDRRLVVAFQPHRYTRTRDLFEDFSAVLSEVDVLALLEVYGAGESPITGADSRSLSRSIRQRGKVDPVFVDQPEALSSVLADVLADGDVLLILGAGSIGGTVAELARQAVPGIRAVPDHR